MQPSEVDVPRSIMDPAPGKTPTGKKSKKPLIIGIAGIALVTLLAIAGWIIFGRSRQSSKDNQNSGTSQPVTTPTPEDISQSAITKQVIVEGRTFTHIVPKSWKTAISEGDVVSPPFEIPVSGAEPWLAALAITYNQGSKALKPNTAEPLCDTIVVDSESVSVNASDERFINFCGKKVQGDTVLTYILFSKYSYKKGKQLSASEQTDLLTNVLLYARVVPEDQADATVTYETLSQTTTFTHTMQILESITYVETQ